MKSLIIVLGILSFSNKSGGQDLDTLLRSVEQKNLRIAAMQKYTEAEQAGLKTDVYPQSAGYLQIPVGRHRGCRKSAGI